MSPTPVQGKLWRSTRPKSRARRPAHTPEPQQAVNQIVELLAGAVRETAAEQFPTMWAALTEAGRAAFAREMADAFIESAPKDRSRAVGEVLESWQRTWVIRQAPGYEDAVIRAEQTAEDRGERLYTLDEIKSLLAQ